MPRMIKDCDAIGWLIISPTAVPLTWQSRAIPMALIPLLPHELEDGLLPSQDATPRDAARLMTLVAQGLSKQRMADDLHISLRTLDRRLRALRDTFGVRSLAELAATAARRGFGGTSDDQR